MSTVLVPSILTPPPGLISSTGQYLGRQELRTVPTPSGTSTHRPIPHHEVVEALIETLGFRKFTVVNDRYALANNGNRMFGVLQVDLEESGVRFCIGVRNSHDKAFSLGLVFGYTTIVCENLSFSGAFEPLMRKHTKNANIQDIVALGVENAQRAWEPMTRKIDAWSHHSLTDDQARLVIYRAFIERDGLTLPRHLGPLIHQEYFEPTYEDFKPRTIRSLEAAFSQTIKMLEPVQQFQATAAVGTYFSQFTA
jgi:hypothetical protein